MFKCIAVIKAVLSALFFILVSHDPSEIILYANLSSRHISYILFTMQKKFAA